MDQQGVLLAGQVGLDEGEGQHRHHQDQEKDGDLVFEEHAHGGAPVGVVGVAAPLGLLGVEGGEGEQLLLGQAGAVDILLQLRGQLVGQVLFHLTAVGAKSDLFHQREPSFLAKLIRGSTMPIRRSPKSRPRMEMAA